MKLTDAQLVILSAAAKRDDGKLLPLPKSIRFNKASATSVLKSLVKHGLATEQPATLNDEAWREGKDSQRFGLVISDAGLEAVGVEPGQGARTKKTPAKRSKKDNAESATPTPKKDKGTKSGTGAGEVRQGTKLALLIDLLKRKSGATIEETAKATGWQHHSVRGAMSGALKKKLGLKIDSIVDERRGRIYRIG